MGEYSRKRWKACAYRRAAALNTTPTTRRPHDDERNIGTELTVLARSMVNEMGNVVVGGAPRPIYDKFRTLS